MKHVHPREQFEAETQKLVGLTLSDVVYYEIEYDTPDPFYLRHPEIGHFLDHGLDLIATDGQCHSFLWDGAFYQYGIGLFPHTAANEVNTNRLWRVSDHDDWIPLIGRTITSANVYWSWIDSAATDERDRTYYPQDVCLSFTGDQRVYISAAQYMEASNTVMGMSDEILVVFRESVARKYRIGPYAKDA